MFSAIISSIIAPVVYGCPASIPVGTITGTPQIAGIAYNKPQLFSNLQIVVGGHAYDVISARVSYNQEDKKRLPAANLADTLGFVMTHNSLDSVPLKENKQYSCVYSRKGIYHINTPIEIEIELKK